MTPSRGVLTETREGTLVSVRVIPRSKEERVSYVSGENRIRVYVRAVPSKGRATEAVLQIFRSMFGESEIKSGLKSRDKVILVKNSSKKDMMSRIVG